MNYCIRHYFNRRVLPSSGQRQFCRAPHTHTVNQTHEWISARDRHFDVYSFNGTNHLENFNALSVMHNTLKAYAKNKSTSHE